MSAFVILNPFSGRGSAGDRKAEVSAALDLAKVDYEIILTEAPRHATKLAKEAVEAGKSPIIAGGGDGLIGEVVNGIGQVVGDGDWPVFGILPLGTANDLVDNLKLPRDLNEAAKRIASGKKRFLDICKANEHYFLNNAGLGLESHISIIQNQMTWAKGDFRYILAALRGILHNPEWTMRLEWDSGSYEGPVKMISIGNGARTGGVFFTVPHADPFDGKITFVYGTIPSRLGIMAQFPKIMKPGEGNYVEHPAVHEVETTWLQVISESPTPLHADGEILSEAIKEIRFEILPGKLPLLFGESIQN
jgi:YegS/Rv2252/BmrU family lipid kinase